MKPQPAPQVTRDPSSLAMILAPWRQENARIAFVPTMGALHNGHLSLIQEARKHAERVVVSIFVNPRQFGPTEDFETYPRTEEDDLANIAKAGGDVAYVPGMSVMYPKGYQTTIALPQLSAPLDGTSRPGFFDGIATAVTKLFNQVRPDVAIFGEKDYQQLLVIRQLTKDLNMDIKIVGAPIVRETDGLAMSSRNRYLGAEERKIAGQLNKIMLRTIDKLANGERVDLALSQAKDDLKQNGLSPIDYFEVRRIPSLDLIDKGVLQDHDLGHLRLFAAVMLGKTRLIDNMSLEVSDW